MAGILRSDEGVAMTTEAQDAGSFLISVIKKALAEMTPEERLSFWELLQEGYCPHCGYPDTGRPIPCQCWNDE